jgi:hypothetical protein
MSEIASGFGGESNALMNFNGMSKKRDGQNGGVLGMSVTDSMRDLIIPVKRNKMYFKALEHISNNTPGILSPVYHGVPEVLGGQSR